MKLFARASTKKGRRKFRLGWKLALLALPLAVVFAILTFYAVWAQTFDMKKVGDMPERNTVFDVDGKIYSRLAGANRLKVALNEVSPFFVDAVIAREDTRFFEHGGIDWRGIARALVKDILSASAKEGASSLTQQ
ncbi:MAG TPA: transglycosylase domain-containing protein, partial [Chthoniobacterales bacterium]|nr:transglycosylase domain-containing protein [Chthoniobacterales bacterium]